MADRNLELALRVKADLAQARKSLEGLESTLRGTDNAAKSAGSSSTQAGRGMDGLGKGAGRANTGAKKLNRTLEKTRSIGASVNRGFHDLRNILVGAFVVHEISRFVGSLVHANIEAQRIHYTLKQVFGAGSTEQYDYVRKEAERLGLSLADTAEGYAQLAAAAQGTGTSTKALQSVFTGMNEAATVLHASTADVAGVFTQLAQGISLGKLQMQDIRAISQHLPGTMTVLQEAAKKLGTTLEYSLAHGGLDAKKMLEAIGEVLHERFGRQAKEAAHSLNAELNRLKSTLFEIQTDDNSFEGKFADAVRQLNQTLSDPGFKAGLENLIDALGTIIQSSVKAAAKLGDLLAGLKGYAEYAAAMQHGAGGFDLGGLSVERGKIKAELEQRAAHPTLSAINSFLADTENNPVQNALEGGRPRIQSMSTKQLQQRLGQIDAQITRLKKLQNDQRVRNAEAQKAAMQSAAGDFIDSILAPSKTPTPRGGNNNAARKKAAALAKAAAQANQQLRDTFIQLQTAQDPTAAAWARYNEVVGKANQRVTDAKTKLDALVAAGKLSRAEADRRIASNQALANGIEYMARKTREAAIGKLADADRKAWEKLKDSLRTPAEVAADDAIAKLKELNRLLKAGDSGLTQAQYAEASRKIGKQSVTQAPQYQGLSPEVGGIGSDLTRNFEAQKALDTWHATQLAQTQKFHQQGELNEQAYQARLAEIDRQYSAQRTKIEVDRGRLQLQTASNLFGQLAQLSTSHNNKMARIGKAAAIAQAVIKTYQSATEAYASLAGIPYVGPALGAAAAGVAIAAGLANVAQIRAQPVGGYAEGGYTGAGGKHQVAGVVHAGEVVWSQDDIARAGGVGMVEAWRRGLPGYAAGGVVNPLANAPSPAELGFQPPSAPKVSMPTPDDGGGQRGGQKVGVRIINSVDPQFVTDNMDSPEGEDVILNTISRNQSRIKQMIG